MHVAKVSREKEAKAASQTQQKNSNKGTTFQFFNTNKIKFCCLKLYNP
jgi:hypothetical protein